MAGMGTNRKAPLEVSMSDALSLHAFCIPEYYNDDLESILLPNGLLTDRVEKLALDISQHYGDVELHVVCILKGSRGFFTSLLKYLNQLAVYSQTQENPPFLEHYARIQPRKEEGGEQGITIVSEDLSTLRGKNILVVEDLISTGQTLRMFCDKLSVYNPASLKVASLLEKSDSKFKGDFVGFMVPDEVLVGFSLDYKEMYRDLNHICVLSERGLKRHAALAERTKARAANLLEGNCV
eukprot:GEMP01033176.1.p1 GENE.GEMP01033176.1~~GEMP01033176.1.p1  ORF type:complete len:238 (+),score=40.69 GEMP01033176.1:45-758(+)